MSRSYWLSLYAAVGLTVGCSTYGYCQAVNHGSRTAQKTAKVQAQPPPNTPPSLPIAVQHNIERIARALEAANTDSDSPAKASDYQRYLTSQTDLARWGLIMLLIGGFEAAITALGVFLVWRTLLAAQASAREAGNTASEAKRQADYAESALAQTRANAETELRAWLDVEAELKTFRSNADYVSASIKVHLTNVGKTPALSVKTSQDVRPAGSIVINGGGLPAIEKYPTSMPSLLPEKSAEQGFGCRIGEKEIAECIAQCKAAVGAPDGLMVIVDVIAYYRTVFDKPDAEMHMTSVRYTIHPRVLISPYDDRSRNWIRSVNQASEVGFFHDKSAPVYMT